jgi:hypothetical protein
VRKNVVGVFVSVQTYAHLCQRCSPSLAHWYALNSSKDAQVLPHRQVWPQNVRLWDDADRSAMATCGKSRSSEGHSTQRRWNETREDRNQG